MSSSKEVDGIKINMPEMFADPEFVTYLNHPDTNIATWHYGNGRGRNKDQEPHEYSDLFLTYDNGSGSEADSMPAVWWDKICAICKETGLDYALVHITNLEE